MNKISPFLWFDTQAEEAANFWTSIFPDSRVTRVVGYPADAPDKKEGETMTVEFELFGQKYVGLNGGPTFKFNWAISLSVACDTQEEVDRYWAALTSDGGKEVQCGWLEDKFGLAWQITPKALDEYLASDDEGVRKRVFEAMMGMVKIDIATLDRAAKGT